MNRHHITIKEANQLPSGVMIKWLKDNKYYIKAEKYFNILSENKFKEATELSDWRDKVDAEWEHISIKKVESNVKEVMYAGDELSVTALVDLHNFKSENVIVEVYHGSLNNLNQIEKGYRVRMEPNGKKGDLIKFKISIPCQTGGHYGYTVRLLPGHANLAEEFLPGRMKWA